MAGFPDPELPKGSADPRIISPRLLGMSKLRDWWPTEDTEEGRNSAAASVDYTRAAAFRLSDVTAALQTCPRATTASTLPQLFSTPPAKAESQDLANELDGKTRSSSSKRQRNRRPPKAPKQANDENKKTAQAVFKRSKKDAYLDQLQQGAISKDPLTRREIHIHSERQRRKGMTLLYGTLHSLLPEAKPKTDRCTVLTDAITHIQTLRKKLEALSRKKAEILASVSGNQKLNSNQEKGECTLIREHDSADLEDNAAEIHTAISEKGIALFTAADVTVQLCGKDAFITVTSIKRKGLWPAILQLLEEQGLEVLNVTLSTSADTDFHIIHAKVPETSELRSYDLQLMIQELGIADTETIPLDSGCSS